jgi:hypothetical protein
MTGRSLLRAGLAYSGIALLVVLPAIAAPLSDPDAGQGQNTTLYVMNTSKTSDATLVVSFVSTDGTPASSSSGATLNPMAAALVSTSDEVTASNWLGSAVLYSDQELASVAKISWSGGTASDGITQAAYTGTGQGSTEVFLPNLFTRPWMYSTIAVQNVSTEEADFTINYYTRGETAPFSVMNDLDVPPDANRYYDLKYAARSTDPSKIPTFPSDDWLGAAVVTSDHDIAVVVTTHWDDYAGAYQGFATEETDYEMFLPSVFKRKFGRWHSYTGILIQNTENATGDISLTLYDRDGNVDAYVEDTIDPLSAVGYNTRYGGDQIGEPFYDLGEDWLGSAVINSTTEIAVQVNTLWDRQTLGASYDGLAPGQGSNEVFLPHMAKSKIGRKWIEWCGAIVQNLSDQTNVVDVYVYPSDGGDPDWTDYYMHFQMTLDPWSSLGTNTRYSSEWDSVPNDWQGTIYLSGQYNIGAIVNCPRSDSAFTYNGYHP